MQIPADTRVRVYELTYLLPVGLTDSELSARRDEIAAIITNNGGEILETDEWGKKELAYTIQYNGKRHTEAQYTHLKVQFEASAVQKCDRALRLEGNLMRYLLVVAEEVAEKTEDKE
jgi:small subunit ribosomal protein S6